MMPIAKACSIDGLDICEYTLPVHKRALTPSPTDLGPAYIEGHVEECEFHIPTSPSRGDRVRFDACLPVLTRAFKVGCITTVSSDGCGSFSVAVSNAGGVVTPGTAASSCVSRRPHSIDRFDCTNEIRTPIKT